MTLYLDASAIIYSIESAPPFRDVVLSRLANLTSPGTKLLTSRLSRLECELNRCENPKPSYLRYTSNSSVSLSCTSSILDRRLLSGRLNCGPVQGSKHLMRSTSLLQSNSALRVFLTGDRAFGKCDELTVELL
jgi:hypothetical protein